MQWHSQQFLKGFPNSSRAHHGGFQLSGHELDVFEVFSASRCCRTGLLTQSYFGLTHSQVWKDCKKIFTHLKIDFDHWNGLWLVVWVELWFGNEWQRHWVSTLRTTVSRWLVASFNCTVSHFSSAYASLTFGSRTIAPLAKTLFIW